MKRLLYPILFFAVIAMAACKKTDDPPTVVSFSPANNATGVATNTTLTITFNENITPGTGLITLKYDSTNTVAGTFPISSNVSVIGNTAVITGLVLQNGTTYYVEVPSGAFKDLGGNAFAGFSGKTTWKFKTVVAPPTVTPTSSNLQGNYKIQKVTVTPTGSTTETDVTNSWFDACERDDVITLAAGGIYTYTDAGLVCNPNGTYSGNWALINSTTLNLDGDNVTIKRFNNVNLDLTVFEPTIGTITQYLVKQ